MRVVTCRYRAAKKDGTRDTASGPPPWDGRMSSRETGALRIMPSQDTGRIPVVQDHKIGGIATRKDIFESHRALARKRKSSPAGRGGEAPASVDPVPALRAELFTGYYRSPAAGAGG